MISRVQHQIVPVTPFQQNCSVVWSAASRRGLVVDPGGDLDRIEAAVSHHQVTVERIVLTHAHLDHASGARRLAEHYGVPLEGPERADEFWLDALPEQGRAYGFPPTTAFKPDRWLVDGDTVDCGEEQLAVIHCPGHTPGHVVFYHTDGLAFVGDVLFRGSIGRTDLPRGNHAQLLASIRNRLWPLGNEVRFVPGHGPESSFGVERHSNPFVADRLFEDD